MNLICRIVWLSVLWESAQIICSAQNDACNRSPVKCVNASAIHCSNLKYRTMDGSCNNLINPSLGMAKTAFQRLLPSAYEDGIYSMRLAKSGNPLPSARLLSFTVFGRKTIPDPDYTLLNMQWGQIVTHDSSNRLSATNPETKQTCCSPDGKYETSVTSPCFPIPVPDNDPYFKNRECLDFDRSATDKEQNCPGTEDPVPAEQISGVTHYMDLSLVYGNSIKESRSLRTLKRGLLKTQNNRNVWPPQTNNTEAFCGTDESNYTCFEFGDLRGNQNTGLTVLHIVFLREHNRLAAQLHDINPHWDDETLFQEARRINIAQYQYITFYEWNIYSYGEKRLQEEGLIYSSRKQTYVNDYDPCVDPRSLQSFMHSVFRYFHNQIMGKLDLINEPRTINQTIELVDYLFSPGILKQPCKYTQMVRGLSTQAQDLTDENFDHAAAEKYFFESFSKGLRSFDIQRDRDHGLPPYNAFREYCGLKRATSWDDFLDYISSEHVALLQSIYESYEDVDLTIGGSLERHEPNTLIGPTFLCISLKHLKNQRKGDRYFFESGDQPYPFTPNQLREIRKASAARLLCANSPVKHMQPKAFQKISKRNQLRSCSEIPEVNLNAWK